MIIKPNKIAQAVRQAMRYRYDEINRKRELKRIKENDNSQQSNKVSG